MASNSGGKTRPNRGTALGVERDRLSKKQLRATYEITARQLAVHPDLQDLFQRAWEEGWTKERFDSEVEQTDWYRQNAASVREFLLLDAEGGADFEEKQKDTYEFVRRTSMQLGVNLSDQQITELAEKTMMYGWGAPGQEYELQREIAGLDPDGEYGGDIQKNADSLRAMALANGVKFSGGWYESAGKSIAVGLSNPEDWQTEIRNAAATQFPVYAQQIMAGMNVRDLASAYIARMRDEWEMSDEQISLDDPLLLSAIGGVDERGNPKASDLGEFTRALRRDPRWLNTDAAQNKISGVADGVMKMFGLRG